MPSGRLLSKTVATDKSLNRLSLQAQAVYMMTIPHLDRDGLIIGEPLLLMAQVAPLRAAELVSGKYRNELLATTMLGQSKTFHQAEIDAACELADFFRYNAHFAGQIYETHPPRRPGSSTTSITSAWRSSS